MNKFYLILLTAFVVTILPSRQASAEDAKPMFGINFGGFVKTDIIYDTRQTEAFREGHFLLYPKSEKLDANKTDINAKDNFNMLSIQTRLAGTITGPDAFGAKSSAYIEAEFFGTSDADVNGFRLRHAWAKLDWGSTQLQIGQDWHPMFVKESFPGVVSFNTGAPFQPFIRCPQIRFTQTIFDGFKVLAAAAAQRDFSSFGPDAAGLSASSSNYMRNAVIPNFDLQLHFKAGEQLFGVGGDYKIIQPRLATVKNIKTDEKVGSYAALGYARLNLSPVTVKLEGIYGQNLADMLMVGGYALKTVDTTNGMETYSPMGSYTVWGEISWGKTLELAIFGGYSKNLGAADQKIAMLSGSNVHSPDSYYGRALNADFVWRVAPRIVWNSGKARFAAEFEYTSVDYGKNDIDDYGRVINAKTIANARVLLAMFYFF